MNGTQGLAYKGPSGFQKEDDEYFFLTQCHGIFKSLPKYIFLIRTISQVSDENNGPLINFANNDRYIINQSLVLNLVSGHAQSLTIYLHVVKHYTGNVVVFKCNDTFYRYGQHAASSRYNDESGFDPNKYPGIHRFQGNDRTIGKGRLSDVFLSVLCFY